MKKSLRLLITLKCNLTCTYCCNNLFEVSSKFQYKMLDDINFSEYNDICITGGEPFLDRSLLWNVLDVIPKDKPVYIYTNGIELIQLDLIVFTSRHTHVRALNIGLHDVDQLEKVDGWVGDYFPARFMFQDVLENEMFERYPDRLNKNNTKIWVLNQCEVPNEDWVVLIS